MSGRALLAELFQVGVRAVHAGDAVERSLREDDPGDARWTLLAAGKAAGPMAEAALAVLGSRVRAGAVVTKDGHGSALAGLEVFEAGHSLPDARARRLLCTRSRSRAISAPKTGCWYCCPVARPRSGQPRRRVSISRTSVS